MKYLYIDTSSSFLYAAIADDNKLLAEVKEDFGHSLSQEALPKIVSLFEKTKLEANDIDKIIVVNGPGSFTGIRVGLTIAKVFAWSLAIPITTIYSLEAMAISDLNRKVKVPVINARRGYVFAAIYDPNNIEMLKPQHIKIKDLLEHINGMNDYEIITNDEFEEFGKTKKYDPDIFQIISKFKDKKAINAHAVNPEYLKLTEAEESKL